LKNQTLKNKGSFFAYYSLITKVSAQNKLNNYLPGSGTLVPHASSEAKASLPGCRTYSVHDPKKGIN